MVVSAFTGTSFSAAVVDGFSTGIRIGSEVQEVIARTAQEIPTKVSATWLNWMIVRIGLVLPTQYLLQMNTFLFSFLGLTCCSRVVRGGGEFFSPFRFFIFFRLHSSAAGLFRLSLTRILSNGLSSPPK